MNPEQINDLVLQVSEEFYGHKLRPVSAGTHLILEQVKNKIEVGSIPENENDPTSLHAFGFIYARYEAPEKLRKLATNRDAYNSAVAEWIETIVPELDYDNAKSKAFQMVGDYIERWKKAQFETRSDSQKKT